MSQDPAAPESPPAPVAAAAGWRPTLAIATVVLALFALRATRTDARWSSDAVYHFAFVESTRSVTDTDYTGRRHPLFWTALAAADRLAGPRLPPLLAVTYAGHLAAALLLVRLVVACGGSERAAHTAGLLFAAFPGANNLFADPIHFERTWNLALALGALVALSRGRGVLYVFLYAATLANYEDAVLLPLAGIAFFPRAWRTHAAALALLLAAATMGGAAGTVPGLALGTHVLAQALRLPAEVAHAALVPRPEVILARVLRFLVPGVLLLLCAVRARGSVRIAAGPLPLLCLLALVFAAPYVFRPFGPVWPSRYLYFPAAPLLACAGLVLASARNVAIAALLAWCLAVGATTTEIAADAIAARHLHAFAAGEAQASVRAVAYSLDGWPARVELGGDGCAFLARVPAGVPIRCVPR